MIMEKCKTRKFALEEKGFLSKLEYLFKKRKKKEITAFRMSKVCKNQLFFVPVLQNIRQKNTKIITNGKI